MHMTRSLTRISKACGSALAALLLIAAPAADASFSVDVRTSGTVPDLPDPAGRAGMVAGTVTEDDGSQSVIAAGGANFPQARRLRMDCFSRRRSPSIKMPSVVIT